MTNNLNTDTPVRVDSIESEKSLDSSTTLKVTENTINKEVNIENTEKLSETVEDMLSSFVDEVIVDLKK